MFFTTYTNFLTLFLSTLGFFATHNAFTEIPGWRLFSGHYTHGRGPHSSATMKGFDTGIKWAHSMQVASSTLYTYRSVDGRLVIIFNSRYIVLEMVDKQDRLKGAFLEGIAPEEKRRICIIKTFGGSLISRTFSRV